MRELIPLTGPSPSTRAREISKRTREAQADETSTIQPAQPPQAPPLRDTTPSRLYDNSFPAWSLPAGMEELSDISVFNAQWAETFQNATADVPSFLLPDTDVMMADFSAPTPLPSVATSATTLFSETDDHMRAAALVDAAAAWMMLGAATSTAPTMLPPHSSSSAFSSSSTLTAVVAPTPALLTASTTTFVPTDAYLGAVPSLSASFAQLALLPPTSAASADPSADVSATSAIPLDPASSWSLQGSPLSDELIVDDGLSWPALPFDDSCILATDDVDDSDDTLGTASDDLTSTDDVSLLFRDEVVAARQPSSTLLPSTVVDAPLSVVTPVVALAPIAVPSTSTAAAARGPGLYIDADGGGRSFLRSSTIDRPCYSVRLVPAPDVVAMSLVSVHAAVIQSSHHVSSGANPAAQSSLLLNAPFALVADGAEFVASCELVFEDRHCCTAVQHVRFHVELTHANGARSDVWSAPSRPICMRSNISQFLRSEAAVVQHAAFGTECVSLSLVMHSKFQSQSLGLHTILPVPDAQAALGSCLVAISNEIVALCNGARTLCGADLASLAAMMVQVAGADVRRMPLDPATSIASQLPVRAISARDFTVNFFEPFWGRVLRYLNNRRLQQLWSEQRAVLGFASRAQVTALLRSHAAVAAAADADNSHHRHSLGQQQQLPLSSRSRGATGQHAQSTSRGAAIWTLVWLVGDTLPAQAASTELAVPELSVARLCPITGDVSFSPLSPTDMDQPLRDCLFGRRRDLGALVVPAPASAADSDWTQHPTLLLDAAAAARLFMSKKQRKGAC